MGSELLSVCDVSPVVESRALFFFFSPAWGERFKCLLRQHIFFFFSDFSVEIMRQVSAAFAIWQLCSSQLRSSLFSVLFCFFVLLGSFLSHPLTDAGRFRFFSFYSSSYCASTRMNVAVSVLPIHPHVPECSFSLKNVRGFGVFVDLALLTPAV